MECGATDLTDVSMNMIPETTGFWLALPLLPPAIYAGLYVALRMVGKLCVSRDGWQAASICLAGAIVVTALALFRFFERPLCWESRMRRCLGGKNRQDEPVSEVVVEVVSIA